MDRPGALAALNRRILEEYSRRTSDTLRQALPLRLALPHLELALARNVAKEVRKDALVIHHAGKTVAAGSSPERAALHSLLEETKEIDRAFLAQVGRLPIKIVIPYDEIAPVRIERIERLHRAACRILDVWPAKHGVRAAVQAGYPRAELDQLLLDLLRLYALETQALSRSVRLPALLIPVREYIAQSLYDIMNETAQRLAGELADTVYRRQCTAGYPNRPVM